MTQLERELSRELRLQHEAFERELKRVGDKCVKALEEAEKHMKTMQSEYESELRRVVSSYEQKLKEIAEAPAKVELDDDLGKSLEDQFIALEKKLEGLQKQLANGLTGYGTLY